MLYDETYQIPHQRYYDDNIEVINNSNFYYIRIMLFNFRILSKILNDLKDEFTNIDIFNFEILNFDFFQDQLIQIMVPEFNSEEISDETLEQFWNYFKQNCYSEELYCNEIIKIFNDYTYLYQNFLSTALLEEKQPHETERDYINRLKNEVPKKLYNEFIKINSSDAVRYLRSYFCYIKNRQSQNHIMKNFVILYFYQKILNGVRIYGRISSNIILY